MSATLTERPPAPPAPPPHRGSRLSRWRSSWRISLKMARRDALRYKGRSALVIVMVALPVALIVGGLTFATTATIGLEERLPRLLGPGVAYIHGQPADTATDHGVDGSNWGPAIAQPSDTEEAPQAREIPGYAKDAPLAEQTAALTALVGGTLVPVSLDEFRWSDGARHPSGTVMYADTTVDLAPKLALVSGRMPLADNEVAVTPAGVHGGLPESGDLEITTGGATRTVTVVGVADAYDANIGMSYLLAPIGARPAEASGWDLGWIMLRDTPVEWAEVEDLNRYGLNLTSAAAVADPPPPDTSEWHNEDAQSDSEARLMAAIFGAVLFLVTALLVGPAFAVSAGRQRRSLALAASNGAETRQLRRSVLAGALILGGLAAVAATALAIAGVAAGAALWLRLRPWSTLVGPVDIPWVAVLIVLICAILAALTAALIPALRLGRLDIVGVMKGQNVSPPANRILPLVGVILFALGALGLFLAVTQESSSAGVMGVFGLVVGAVLCIPTMLVLAGRVAGRFPVAVRMATRDAARQRHRSAPTVAALMAGAALLATFAIALESDTRFQEKYYTPQTIEGEARLWGIDAEFDPRPLIAQRFPDWVLVQEKYIGNDESVDTSTVDTVEEPFFSVVPPGCTSAQAAEPVDFDAAPPTAQTHPCQRLTLNAYIENIRGGIEVLPAAEIVRRLGLTGSEADAVRSGAIALDDDSLIEDGSVRVAAGTRAMQTSNGEYGPVQELREASLEAVSIPDAAYASGGAGGWSGALLTTEAAERLGLPLVDGGIYIHDPGGAIPEADADVINEAATYEVLYVEQGFQRQDAFIMWGVFGIAGLLLVVVTLISTALALAEQQADMGTLAAVGATKGTRRRFAAAQAATVAVLGGLLGIAIGLVAGVAIAYPSTTTNWTQTGPVSVPPTVGIPALPILAILVGVPLLAAAVAALSIRRAPHVTRRGT